jgi:hypothetical protein
LWRLFFFLEKAMSKGNTFENDILKLIFTPAANGSNIANLADNAQTGALTSLFVALHTADPGEAGNQDTTPATYNSYARVAVARTTGGWSVINNEVKPIADITFPAATSGTVQQTITHFSIGVAASGATKILYKGTVSPALVVSEGVTPRLTTATTITED